MRKWFFFAAAAVGLGIAYIDSRPIWDDAGITAGAVLLSCGLLAFFSPRKPWLWALAVGIWIPLAAVFFNHNYSGFLALAFAFAGAYGGALIRRLVDTARR